MQKRGQIQSHVFLYILSIIVIALVLLFGFKAISSLNKNSEQVELVRLQNQLTGDVDSISKDYGSEKIANYEIPPGFNGVCFVDLEKVNTDLIINHPIIKESVESGVKKNVFLSGEDNFESLYIEGISISDPYFACTQPRNKEIGLKIEGKGNEAIVKSAPIEKYCQNAHDGYQSTGDFILCLGLNTVFGQGYQAECCKEYNLCCED